MKNEFKSYLLAEIPSLRKYDRSLFFFLKMHILCWLNTSYMIRDIVLYKKSYNLIKRINRIRYNRLLI